MDKKQSVPQELRGFFEKHNKIALAFSGGADSSYLLYAAGECGAAVRAYYVKTQFQPAFELEDARRCAEECGAELRVLELSALGDERVAENPPDRCYYCKNNIFGSIMAEARRDGFEHIMDGTNASDEAGDRPGMRALSEMGVLSPLRLCGITKAAVREYSKYAGLFTWNKPAYACLATRIPSGMRITEELLSRVEGAEEALFALGFTDFRVRVSGGCARLQILAEQFMRAAEQRKKILAELSVYFEEITLDMRARGE